MVSGERRRRTDEDKGTDWTEEVVHPEMEGGENEQIEPEAKDAETKRFAEKYNMTLACKMSTTRDG